MPFDEIDLHRAMERDEFYPFFQPMIELRTGQLAGFELLARWLHPRLGLINPDDFIPALEKIGIINGLTRQILEKAFAASPVIPASCRLSVNLSPVQLLDPSLPANLAATAAKAGFSLDRLTIEITESALLVDLPRSQSVARELKDLHCRLALDDFGTGYSSLKHLQALPFDELKVDRSFVSSMTQSRESRKIVATVVGLGRSLGLTTVAEGVETQEQANMLLWLGCDLGQGYLYDRPAPADDLPAVVARQRRTGAACMVAPADGSQITSLEALPGQRFAQLQAIYDSAPVGLALLDRNLRYVSLNRRLAQMNGAPLAAHLGRPITELVPDMYPQFEGFLHRALEGEAILNFEVQRPNFEAGTGYRTLMISYQPVRDEAGEVMGVSIVVNDVSERKRFEDALKEAEQHFHSMVELNPQTPWVMDNEGRTIEVSSRWEKLTGLNREQALGFGWLDALHPDDVMPVKQSMDHALSSWQATDVQYRVKCPEGGWKWIRSRGYPRFDSSGKVLCWYGGLEDIQELKQTEDALQRREAELQAIANAAPLGIVVAEAPEGSIVLVNPQAQRIFQNAILTAQTIPGYSQWGALRADGRPLKPDEYPLARAILLGETTMEQVFLPRQNGAPVQIALSAVPILSPSGQTIGAFMFIDDNLPEANNC